MKIAILTSGILPVPATKGGAVENLTDFYLEYNDKYQLHDITVYSVDDEDAMHHPALQSAVNHYSFVDVRSFGAKSARISNICSNATNTIIIPSNTISSKPSSILPSAITTWWLSRTGLVMD